MREVQHVTELVNQHREQVDLARRVAAGNGLLDGAAALVFDIVRGARIDEPAETGGVDIEHHLVVLDLSEGIPRKIDNDRLGRGQPLELGTVEAEQEAEPHERLVDNRRKIRCIECLGLVPGRRGAERHGLFDGQRRIIGFD